LAKALDPGWIDHTDDMTGVMQVLRQRFAVCPGCLHADVGVLYVVLPEPAAQHRESCRAVAKHAVCFLVSQEQRRTEFLLADVDAHNR
jgi:hypothetical protein